MVLLTLTYILVLLKTQEGLPLVDNEFDFDGYSLDNIPV